MKREVKIGIFAVTMIVAAWAGIRFLQGLDILSRNAVYYASYDQVSGIQAASPIMLKGVKVGTVTGISLDPQHSDNVVLQFTIKRQFRIPKDSEAKIFSDGLEFFKQKISQVTADLSRTLDNLNLLMENNAQSINGTLRHLDAMSGDLADLLDTEKQNLASAVENLTAFSEMLGENAPRVDSMMGNLNRITTELADAGFARELSETVGEMNLLLERIQEGDGTVGRLLNDPSLYESLNEASDNLASLLANLEQYPGRYVHFSLFGRSPEKMQAKAERQAAKAAERARRDSLKALR